MAEFEDATGLFRAIIEVDRGDGFYPSFVQLDLEEANPPSILSVDARALAGALIRAADEADRLDLEARTNVG